MKANKMQMRLTDGTPVFLRPWITEDHHYVPEALANMAQPIGYLRYFAPATPIFNEDQAELASAAATDHQRVWVALDALRARQPILGVARLIQFEHKPWLAQVVLAVHKDYQGRGLGRILLGTLYLAAESEGVRDLRGLVQSENERAIDWFKRLGASTQPFLDEIVELDLPICEEPVLLPQNETSRQFQQVMSQMEEAYRL